jgi:hypothetical protein
VLILRYFTPYMYKEAAISITVFVAVLHLQDNTGTKKEAILFYPPHGVFVYLK